jgi:adenylate kinase
VDMQARNYVVTGVSGCGRIELLEELKEEFASRHISANVLDVGKHFVSAAQKISPTLSDRTILNIDTKLQAAVSTIALREVQLEALRTPADINLIGVHATFRWRGRLMRGINYRDLSDMAIHGFVNVVDNATSICEANGSAAKWKDSAPNLEETQDWLREEEFVTEVLADYFDVPVFLVGRSHRVPNLADLFCTQKPRAYLSYPITAVRSEHPERLEELTRNVVPRLEECLVVFDPLVIRDMEYLNRAKASPLPASIADVTERAADQIEDRTIERDYQFIDQSDLVIVVYETDKSSPGVIHEMSYASRNDKPVLAVFPHARSPFLERNTSRIFQTTDELLQFLASPELAELVGPIRHFGALAC